MSRRVGSTDQSSPQGETQRRSGGLSPTHPTTRTSPSTSPSAWARSTTSRHLTVERSASTEHSGATTNIRTSNGAPKKSPRAAQTLLSSVTGAPSATVPTKAPTRAAVSSTMNASTRTTRPTAVTTTPPTISTAASRATSGVPTAAAAAAATSATQPSRSPTARTARGTLSVDTFTVAAQRATTATAPRAFRGAVRTTPTASSAKVIASKPIGEKGTSPRTAMSVTTPRPSPMSRGKEGSSPRAAMSSSVSTSPPIQMSRGKGTSPRAAMSSSVTSPSQMSRGTEGSSPRAVRSSSVSTPKSLPTRTVATASQAPRRNATTPTPSAVPPRRVSPSSPQPASPAMTSRLRSHTVDPSVVGAFTVPPCACGACGDACLCQDCVCADELCQCKAFQLVHSINGGTSGIATGSSGQVTFDFVIDGMTCSMCSQAIERAVNAVPGVDLVQVSLSTDTATVTWSASEGDDMPDRIVQTIEEIGYQVVNVVPLSPSRRPDSSSGDDGETAGEASSSVHVAERWQQYRDHQTRKVQQRRAAALWALLFTLPIVVWTMILPHFMPHAFDHWRSVTIPHWLVPLAVSAKSVRVDVLAVWFMATLVQFVSGWDFYRMAWHGFRRQTAGMDLLIVLGTTASYGYATNGVWTNDPAAVHFFETSAVLIVLVLVGKWMQATAVRHTGEALMQLMELQSTTAIQITPHNDARQKQQHQPFNPLTDPYNEEIVSIEHIKAGDVVKVLRGASIPADGVVLYGEISVDESMMTGESFPVLKTRGSVVLGGTICVESGSGDSNDLNIGAAFVQVTGVGSSTALAQMVQLVQQAQSRTVPIQAFADRVSAVFVPTVCMISLVTYLVWYALCSTNVVPTKWYRDDLGEDSMTFSLKFAIACLVISCPCALGLATPTAVMVGTGVSAKRGVLMKGGAAIEIASQVDTVIFDKTGTLTKGVPAVSEIHHFTSEGKYDSRQGGTEFQSHEDYLLWLFGSLERTSEHPLARAIVTFANEKLGDAIEQNPFVHPTDFRAITGRGASGVIMGKISVAIGNRSFASVLGLRVSSTVDKCMSTLEAGGKSAILAAVDGTVCCVLGVADEVKPDAAMSVMYLREVMGFDVWMVTGDNSRTAAAISRKVGIPSNRVVAEALPAAKLERIKLLQAEGRVVCMVGDGINDSAALAQADVGIGMGTTGAEIAMEAADIILVKGKVADVCTALHLSRAIFRRIQWNLALSLVYNCMGIPIAAGAFYFMVRSRLPPTVAAVAMALSSVSVVLSSLSLRFYRPPKMRDVLRRYQRASRSNTANGSSSRERLSSHLALDSNDDMRASLLSNDHMESSDATIRVDNRTVV